jgi:cyclopropane-fatty-acyl-phospholipid synthase
MKTGYILLILIIIIVLVIVFINSSTIKEYLVFKKLNGAIGQEVEFVKSNESSGNQEKITVLILDHKDFVDSLWSKGEVGLGESYSRGSWSCNRLYDFLKVLNKNQNKLQSYRNRMSYNTQSSKEDKKSISQHYDVGNDFYNTFLTDSFKTYSCAIWSQPFEKESLDAAQQRKIDIIIRKLNLKPDAQILDIGCGWGKIADYVSKKTGANVTGITLSENQLDYAKTLSNENLKFLLKDYRNLPENVKYDGIYSIGMLEHVRGQNFDLFFNKIHNILQPGGKFVLHTIISGREKMDQKNALDCYVTTHIFPNGQIPHLNWIEKAVRNNKMQMQHVEYFGGQHYAETLKVWKQQMISKSDKILEMGYNKDLLRSYEYYFTICEAAFRIGDLHVAHIIIVNSPELHI